MNKTATVLSVTAAITGAFPFKEKVLEETIEERLKRATAKEESSLWKLADPDKPKKASTYKKNKRRRGY